MVDVLAIEFDTGQEVATPRMIAENVGQGKDTSYGQELRDQTNTLKSLGFNADWKVNDTFSLAFDIHDSTMESLPTGYGGGGATAEDVHLMRETVGPEIGVKASGGIRTKEDVEAMVAAGATRIGASAGVKIVRGEAGEGRY